MPGKALLDHFSGLEDPRQSWKVIYPLPEIMLLVLCGTLSMSDRRYPREQRFPGLKAIAMVESQVERGGQTSREPRYYVSSLPLDARLFARAVRAHWGIENRLHWMLDVVFHDDLMRLHRERPQEHGHCQT